MIKSVKIQVQKLINAGIQNEMAAMSHQFTDENNNPKIPPTPSPPPQSANVLTDNDLVRLANLLQDNNTKNNMDLPKLSALIKGNTTPTKTPGTPKVYTGTT